MRLVVAVICSQTLFSKSTGWISTTKISQDNFSKADSEKYLGFSTLLRSPDKSTMPRIVDISGGIDICGKPSKSRLKTVLVFQLFAKVDQKICN